MRGAAEVAPRTAPSPVPIMLSRSRRYCRTSHGGRYLGNATHGAVEEELNNAGHAEIMAQWAATGQQFSRDALGWRALTFLAHRSCLRVFRSSLCGGQRLLKVGAHAVSMPALQVTRGNPASMIPEMLRRPPFTYAAAVGSKLRTPVKFCRNRSCDWIIVLRKKCVSAGASAHISVQTLQSVSNS